MLNFGNKEFRNLQEQVQKNKEDIEKGVGIPGPVGPQGEMGPQGPQGPEGPRGPQGIQGIQGPRGQEGPMGPVGPRGPRGLAGEQGPAGKDGTVSFEELTPEQIAMLKGPKGDKGDAGARGEKGETGPQGPAGVAGATGPQGERGPKGDKGDKGEKGERGDNGAAGPQGPQGPKGDKGDPGEAIIPDNVVLTDTDQTITGKKTFTNNLWAKSTIFADNGLFSSDGNSYVSITNNGSVGIKFHPIVGTADSEVKFWGNRMIVNDNIISYPTEAGKLALTSDVEKVEAKIPSVEGLATVKYVDESVTGLVSTSEMEDYVEDAIKDKADKSEIPSVEGLATKSELEDEVIEINAAISAVEEKIPSVEGLASEQFVVNKIAEAGVNKQDKLDSWSDHASVSGNTLTVNYKVRQEDGSYEDVPVSFTAEGGGGGGSYSAGEAIKIENDTISVDGTQLMNIAVEDYESEEEPMAFTDDPWTPQFFYRERRLGELNSLTILSAFNTDQTDIRYQDDSGEHVAYLAEDITVDLDDMKTTGQSQTFNVGLVTDNSETGEPVNCGTATITVGPTNWDIAYSYIKIDGVFDITDASDIQYQRLGLRVSYKVNKSLDQRVREIASESSTYVSGEVDWETDTWTSLNINGESHHLGGSGSVNIDNKTIIRDDEGIKTALGGYIEEVEVPEERWETPEWYKNSSNQWICDMDPSTAASLCVKLRNTTPGDYKKFIFDTDIGELYIEQQNPATYTWPNYSSAWTVIYDLSTGERVQNNVKLEINASSGRCTLNSTVTAVSNIYRMSYVIEAYTEEVIHEADPSIVVGTTNDQVITGHKRFADNTIGKQRGHIDIGANSNEDYALRILAEEGLTYFNVNSSSGAFEFVPNINNSNYNIRIRPGSIEPRYSNSEIDLGRNFYKWRTLYCNNLSDGTTTKTVTELLSGIAPSNMMTTDTEQFISGEKKWYDSDNQNYLAIGADFGNGKGIEIGNSDRSYVTIDKSGIQFGEDSGMSLVLKDPAVAGSTPRIDLSEDKESINLGFDSNKAPMLKFYNSETKVGTIFTRNNINHYDDDLGTNYTYSYPTKSGTLAVTSDIPHLYQHNIRLRTASGTVIAECLTTIINNSPESFTSDTLQTYLAALTNPTVGINATGAMKDGTSVLPVSCVRYIESRNQVEVVAWKINSSTEALSSVNAAVGVNVDNVVQIS